jgi:hypothetical protein
METTWKPSAKPERQRPKQKRAQLPFSVAPEATAFGAGNEDWMAPIREPSALYPECLFDIEDVELTSPPARRRSERIGNFVRAFHEMDVSGRQERMLLSIQEKTSHQGGDPIAAYANKITEAVMGSKIDSFGREMQSLRSTIVRLEQQVERMLAPVLGRVQSLEEKLGQLVSREAETPDDENVIDVSDERLDWISTHPEEVAKHRGERIAVHARDGIVASGKTYKDVRDLVKAKGYQGQVLVTSVPPA